MPDVPPDLGKIASIIEYIINNASSLGVDHVDVQRLEKIAPLVKTEGEVVVALQMVDLDAGSIANAFHAVGIDPPPDLG